MPAMLINISVMNLFGHNPHLNFGYAIYDAHGSCGPRIQQNLQLVYIYEGEAIIDVNGAEHRLRAGEATLLVPGRREYFLFSKEKRTRHGWCEVRNAQLEKAVRTAYEELPFCGPLTPQMRTLAKMAMALRPEARASGQLLYDALARAMMLSYLAAVGFGDKPPPPLPEPLRRALDRIETRYGDACSVEMLARTAGVSGTHLIRLFRQHLGTTPMQCVWKRRVEAGAQLLRETGLAISEVAYQCGFQTPFHFSRMLKNHSGQSPRAYRRKTWGIGEKKNSRPGRR